LWSAARLHTIVGIMLRIGSALSAIMHGKRQGYDDIVAILGGEP